MTAFEAGKDAVMKGVVSRGAIQVSLGIENGAPPTFNNRIEGRTSLHDGLACEDIRVDDRRSAFGEQISN